MCPESDPLNLWFKKRAQRHLRGAILLKCGTRAAFFLLVDGRRCMEPKNMRYWLMKSEPDEFSIDDLARAPKKTAPWFGVRNYQARNFMRDQMQLGDQAFFYHSSCEVPGIAGIVEDVRSSRIPTPRNSTARANISTPRPRATSRAGSTSTSSWSKKTRLVPLVGTARLSAARRHAAAAARQPAVDHAGRSGRMEIHPRI